MDRIGRKKTSILATQMPAHQRSTGWRHGMIKTCAVLVEISVNPCPKRLHITISEMDTPLGGTRMQSIRGKMYNLIGSCKIICIHEGHI